MNPPPSLPAVDARLLAAVGIASAAVTAQQVILLQVLAWTHWHHFAYLVVALALLGFGIAGTVLTLLREFLFCRAGAAVTWLLVGLAVLAPLGVRLAQAGALAVDLPLVFFAPVNTWRLVALCGLLLPPFFAGGLVTGLLLALHAATPARLYAASLGGAGAGGLLGLAFVAQLAPPRLSPAVGLLAFLAVVCRWRGSSRGERLGMAGAAALLAVFTAWPGRLAASEFKPLSRALELPGARIVAQRAGLRGWVQIVSAPALRPAPVTSLVLTDEVPVQPAVFVDGLPYGALPDAAAVRNAGWLDFTTDAAAYAVGPVRRVLLLENGPGGWSTLAVRHGARRVVVVEPNRALVSLVTAGGEPLAPEWRLPGVSVVTADARAFLRREHDAFDVIRLPTAGALGGTAGLGSASEQLLLTREAVRDAWERLSPQGVLTVSAWMDFPERNPLRLLATLAETVAGAGAAPRAHLAAVRSWAAVTFLVRRSPWDAVAVNALSEFCAARGFDVLLAPGAGRAVQPVNHAWQNPAFFELVDELVDGPREHVYARYPFLLRPPTDRRPYFSQFMRLSHVGRLREVFGTRAMPFFELGSLVVALAFVLLSALAVVCIVLPLARRGWPRGGKAPVLLYFGGLGAGYMAFETGAMLAARAWLGSPVTAAAGVITVLLLASGAGSLWSERLGLDRGRLISRGLRRRVTAGRPARVADVKPAPHGEARAMATAVPLIAAVIAVAGVGLVHGLAWLRPLPATVALAALLTLVAGPGLLMGMALPLGLRWLAAVEPAQVPWAWAVNACVSVATPAGAMLLAMTSGFGAVFALAALSYVAAWLGTRMRPDGPR